ncbi:40S ribosomal protein S30-B [Lachnellula suecica]|uniref:40S ribosomal protein S30-B n=1 Tax=Lachnellula suecica TaxID=602035 RepID=A0A8T9CJX9_9HELO|nr:40S ribosomal protein S30-B [Lachnellula suecica]
MGKVHGSLARAGKVKSQTPKVRHILILVLGRGRRMLEAEMMIRESHGRHPFAAMDLDDVGTNKYWNSADGFASQVEPQEKKKTPKGRAKKRITYTRRFVNVTLTGGKRKMNPNPTT